MPKSKKPSNCSNINSGELKRLAKRLHACASFPLTSTSTNTVDVTGSLVYITMLHLDILQHTVDIMLFSFGAISN